MTFSIKTKIVLAFFIVALLNGAFAFGYYQFYLADKFMESTQIIGKENAQYRQQLIESIVALYPDERAIASLIRTEAATQGIQMTMTDLDGRDIAAAAEQREGIALFQTKEVVRIQGEAVYLIDFQYPDWYEQVKPMKSLLLLVIAVLVLSVIGLIFYLQSHIVKPLTLLHTYMKTFHFKNMKLPKLERRQDEIGELMKDFAEMGQRLETSHNEQVDMIAAVSHDIKTPLTSIIGYVERLSGSKTLTEAKKEDYYRIIHRKAKDIEKLVEDFSAFSDMEHDTLKITTERVDVRSFIQSICTEYQEELQAHQARLDWTCQVPEDVQVELDMKKIRRVFANIVHNALIYVSPPVHLRLNCELQDGSLRIAFEDNGEGVPDEELERIFDKLYRVDPSRSRAGGGSGLGLATCKSMIEAHGGRIHAYRNPLGGLGIYFTLPL
ncbi:HAMP domain-containing sensor histidine kinase [Paenibacillus dendritiformis]|uniref:sensor histidine kinase n=1 Tax=Paenibacillus dendritiformis TaxID=130049 RepID=UPI00248BAD17|nr:HAMP domain-containing sensor histidine kinase [Paenibacillus dendritiformis]WGU95981.1 HAMP domain-containing sensor histidine kinase [Paenibacillus dendritiformis]